jgi:hypothetical protein
MSEELRLSDAIKKLRAELEDAQSEGTDKKLRFVAKTVEVELALVLKSEVEGKVGVKAWFVDASGKAGSASESRSKLKLTLEPIGPGGSPALVSDPELESKLTK